MTDWQRNEYTRFAWAGGTCPRFAWAWGTFSPVVQFLVLAGNRFWFYILLMYLGYCTIQLWCCVSFFGIFFVVAWKWFWREIGSFFVVAGKFYYDWKKKVTVVCLAGCAVVSVFGSGNYEWKKKSSSRLSGKLCCCFEHLICISSTSIKTNTNPLVQLHHIHYI